jgi:hypothetical protein
MSGGLNWFGAEVCHRTIVLRRLEIICKSVEVAWGGLRLVEPLKIYERATPPPLIRIRCADLR